MHTQSGHDDSTDDDACLMLLVCVLGRVLRCCYILCNILPCPCNTKRQVATLAATKQQHEPAKEPSSAFAWFFSVKFCKDIDAAHLGQHRTSCT